MDLGWMLLVNRFFVSNWWSFLQLRRSDTIRISRVRPHDDRKAPSARMGYVCTAWTEEDLDVIAKKKRYFTVKPVLLTDSDYSQSCCYDPVKISADLPLDLFLFQLHVCHCYQLIQLQLGLNNLCFSWRIGAALLLPLMDPADGQEF